MPTIVCWTLYSDKAQEKGVYGGRYFLICRCCASSVYLPSACREIEGTSFESGQQTCLNIVQSIWIVFMLVQSAVAVQAEHFQETACRQLLKSLDFTHVMG